jgi:hypothetical protein
MYERRFNITYMRYALNHDETCSHDCTSLHASSEAEWAPVLLLCIRFCDLVLLCRVARHSQRQAAPA